MVSLHFATGRLGLLKESLASGAWWLAAHLLLEAHTQQDWGPLGLGGPLSYYSEAGLSRSRASVLIKCAKAGTAVEGRSCREAYDLACR